MGQHNGNNGEEFQTSQQPKKQLTCHYLCKNQRHKVKCLGLKRECEQLVSWATLLSFVLLNGIITLSSVNSGFVQADDSAAAPAFDIGMLSNLATNLGSNPQIMSLVSNLLNPAGQKPAVGSPPTSVSGGLHPDMGGISDLDPNSIVQENTSGPQQQQVQSSNVAGGLEPLRRGVQPTGVDQQVQMQQAAQAPASVAAQASVAPVPQTNAAASPLSGLLSMLPGVLSGLSAGGSAGGGLGGLTSLLGLNKMMPPQPPQQQSPQPIPQPQQQQQQQQQQQPLQQQLPQSASMASSRSGGTDFSSQTSVSSSSVAEAPAPPQQPQMAPSSAPNSAQSVINQVLTAYASGQIPNELIQLGLSGRVPPQIIELALSGQVPSQIIQMIITGQVPMSTINTFLGTLQQANGASRAATDAGSTSNSGTKNTSNPGVFSTTRSLFEALFGLARKNVTNQGLSVPTLLGNIPLKIPSLPNMRSFGQLVGGTISNLSSMIPF